MLRCLHQEVFPDTVWEEAFWHKAILDPGMTVLVAGRKAAPGGFVLSRQVLDEAEILTIGVLPAGRRQGQARALLAAIQTQLQASGAARLFLEVAEDNHPALRLYEQAGFGSVGHRKDYYGAGRSAILMEWRSGLPRGGDAA